MEIKHMPISKAPQGRGRDLNYRVCRRVGSGPPSHRQFVQSAGDRRVARGLSQNL
jgi:hypothetical protein